MPLSREDRQAELDALPPQTHVTFCHRALAPGHALYWYATWLDKAAGKTRTLYLGKEPPRSHPCLDGTCRHPFRHHQPKKPAGRSGPRIGYRPGPEAIARMRQAHLGKRNCAREEHA